MKTLFELVKYNSNNIKIIDLLLPSEKNSPLRKLFSIVFSDKFLNDNQAMQAIYGKKNLATFSRLKTRLKEILIKTTLLQNTNLETAHSRVNKTISHYRHSLAAIIFASSKIGHLSIEIAERALVKSMKYHSTDAVLILTKILIRHYGSQEYNKFKLKKYFAIQKKYLRINEWEIKAENFYFDLQEKQLYSFSAQEQLKIKAKNYMIELEKANDIESYFFLLNRYKVKAAYFEYVKDYKSLLKLSDDATKELSTPELSTKISIHNINLRKAWTLIQIGKYDEVIKMSIKDMKGLPSGSFAWYIKFHYKLKAYLYKADYKNAVDLITLMIEEPLFSKLGGNFKELFYTTLGYIHLIVDSGLAGDPKKYKKILPDFKIGKYLNTIPIYSKDKKGINASILLMHVAFLLQRKDYNKIIDRIDSLSQYAFRHLRRDDTFRSNCMIKMVVQMTKADFNPIRTERYTRDLLKQLEEVKLAGSGENIETEIIPYEVLWQIMMKSL